MSETAVTVAFISIFVGTWVGFSVLGLKKKWSSVISIGGGFIVSILSVIPIVLSYAFLTIQKSVLIASLTLLSTVLVAWVWLLVFRIKSTSSVNHERVIKSDDTKRDTQQISDDTHDEGYTLGNNPNKERILRELKKHEEHYDKATCLDCGYEGIAGVVGKKIPWYVTWWVIVPVCFTGIGIIGGLILGLIRASQIKGICECPNCRSNHLAG